MVERVILVILGLVGLIAAVLGSKKYGWFQVVGEFPAMFIGIGLAAGSLVAIVVGVIGPN